MTPTATLSLARTLIEACEPAAFGPTQHRPDPHSGLALAARVFAETEAPAIRREAAVLAGQANVLLETWGDAIAWLEGVDDCDARALLGWAQFHAGLRVAAMATLAAAGSTRTSPMFVAIARLAAGEPNDGDTRMQPVAPAPGDEFPAQLMAATHGASLDDIAASVDALLQRENLTTEQRVAALRTRCNVEADRSDWTAAVAWRRKVIEAGPEAPLHHLELGRELFNASLDEESERALRRAIELGSDTGEAEAALGLLYLVAERFADAETVLRVAVSLRPCNAQATFHLCRALLRLEQADEGRLQLARGAELGDDTARQWCTKNNVAQPAQWFSVGHDYVDAGNFEQAITHYRTAEELWRPHRRAAGDFFSRQLALALSNLGYALLALGRIDEAEKALRQALAERPGLRDAWNHLGNLLSKAGRLPEAVDAFRRCGSLDGRYAGAPYGESAALLDLQQLPEALSAIERAIAIGYNHAGKQADLETRRAKIVSHMG